MDIGNIHPAFVHFPIAFLFAYAVLEIVPLARWFPQAPWSVLTRASLWAGAAFTIPTVITGLLAAREVGDVAIITAHKYAGLVTVAIFIVLAAIHLRSAMKGVDIGGIRWFLRVGAFVGLVGLFVTGALGAAIVYGPTVDPIVSLVTSILGFQ